MNKGPQDVKERVEWGSGGVIWAEGTTCVRISARAELRLRVRRKRHTPAAPVLCGH